MWKPCRNEAPDLLLMTQIEHHHNHRPGLHMENLCRRRNLFPTTRQRTSLTSPSPAAPRACRRRESSTRDLYSRAGHGLGPQNSGSVVWRSVYPRGALYKYAVDRTVAVESGRSHRYGSRVAAAVILDTNLNQSQEPVASLI